MTPKFDQVKVVEELLPYVQERVTRTDLVKYTSGDSSQLACETRPGMRTIVGRALALPK